MSNLNTEKDYQSINEMLDFILTENSKRLYISLPAIVQSFDAATRRCSVLPAIQVIYEDGSSQSMPIINDVPVVFPACSGFTVFMPLTAGDSVLLCFCHRGIQNFKTSFSESLPTLSFLDLHDAVAISGFGQINISPSDAEAASMQTTDGKNAVIIGDDSVTLKKDANTFVLNASEMAATIGGATLTLTSSELTSSVNIVAPDVIGGGISLKNHTHASGSYNVPSVGGVAGESGAAS